MVRAFIMVKADTGEAAALLESVSAFENVTDAHVVAGEFDLIVEADAEEVYDLINSVATEIRALAGVDDTKTYICLE